MAWMDTTYFTVAGTTIHIAGAMEACYRIALAAEAFVQECADTTIEILGRALARVPEPSAAVRDRGTPYLNARVTEFLTSRNILPNGVAAVVGAACAKKLATDRTRALGLGIWDFKGRR